MTLWTRHVSLKLIGPILRVWGMQGLEPRTPDILLLSRSAFKMRSSAWGRLFDRTGRDDTKHDTDGKQQVQSANQQTAVPAQSLKSLANYERGWDTKLSPSACLNVKKAADAARRKSSFRAASSDNETGSPGRDPTLALDEAAENPHRG